MPYVINKRRILQVIMKLYKNVDICDLESITQKGILSMDESGNNNWEEGKRSDNKTSVVYLFKPIKKQNSFHNYGVALLEVDCNAVENKMSVRDTHKNDYIEYITDRVLPSEIKKVIIPEIFSSYIDIPNGIDITWCSLRAEHYGNNGLEMADKKSIRNVCTNF